MNNQKKSAVRVGIGGPVGAGKTSFTAAIVKDLKQRYSVGVITVSYTHLTLPTT